MRRFDIGDKIRCYESGVRGICGLLQQPNQECEEQTMVETADGRFYHAPTRTWEKTDTIYGELQKSGKHMVIKRRKKEIK